jgi:glycosyltransferase involved in cell wall biosynthesis
MKVLLVNSLYHPTELGGAERMVRTLAAQLSARGHDVAVACLAAGAAGVRELEGVRVHYLPQANVYPLEQTEHRLAHLKPVWHLVDCANPVMARRLDQVITREAPDVVHTHNLTGFSTLAWVAASRRRLPIVHTIHDYYLLCLRSTMYSHAGNCREQHLACALASRPKRALSRRVAAAVGVSEFVLERHRAFGAFADVPGRVIRNPCRFPAHAPARPADGPLRVGFLGRIEPAKGIDVLLREMRQLAAADWQLAIAGTGLADYVNGLRAEFTDPRVQWVEAVAAEHFLPRIDVLVVPSRWNDVAPLVVMEAFAFGVPVVGARRGGIPEMIEPGVTGELFDPDVQGSLSNVLRPYLAEPAAARRMGPACAARAAAFQPAENARQYEAVYQQVLGG